MDLPAPLADMARRAVGTISSVMDRSWPRENSTVWEITAPGRRCFIKQHPSARFHDREVTAYRQVVSSLGQGRAPELIASDRGLMAMVITGLPGQVLRDLSLPAATEVEAYRQAGQLLRRIHDVPIAVDGVQGIDRAAGRCEEHLHRADGLLTSPQIALVRACAAQLSVIGPQIAVTATHGDFQPRNFLWDQQVRQLAVIDFERAEPGPAVRDLVRLEYGNWDARPDLRDAFLDGYGRNLTEEETEALRCLAALDAFSGLQWGTAHGDDEVVHRARNTFARLLR